MQCAAAVALLFAAMWGHCMQTLHVTCRVAVFLTNYLSVCRLLFLSV